MFLNPDLQCAAGLQLAAPQRAASVTLVVRNSLALASETLAARLRMLT